MIGFGTVLSDTEVPVVEKSWAFSVQIPALFARCHIAGTRLKCCAYIPMFREKSGTGGRNQKQTASL